MAYNDVEHLRRLIKALGSNCEIFIHIDAYVDDSIFKKTINNLNVHFLYPRIKISWAGISMVDSMIRLLEKAVEFECEFSHYVFLSGSCYPIKSESYINSFFDMNLELSFINFIDLRVNPHYYKQIKNKYIMENPFFIRNKFTHNIHRLIRRVSLHIGINNSWKKDFIPYGGSNWSALTDEAARYVIKFNSDNTWLRKIFKYTYAPDEHYIHSIIGNSNLRYKSTGLQDFKYFGLDYLANIHIIHISLSKWYTINDWDEIKNSDKLFVRKVRSIDGYDLVEKINSHIIEQ